MIATAAICWLTFSSYSMPAGNQEITVRVDSIQAVESFKEDESFLMLDGNHTIQVLHSREEVLIMMQEDCNGMD